MCLSWRFMHLAPRALAIYRRTLGHPQSGVFRVVFPGDSWYVNAQAGFQDLKDFDDDVMLHHVARGIKLFHFLPLCEVFKSFFVSHTFLLDVGPEHLLRKFLLLVAVASRVLPIVWSLFSGYLKWRYCALPFNRNSLRPTWNFSRYVMITFIFRAWKACWSGFKQTGLKGALAQVEFHESRHGWYAVFDASHFHPFSPSQGESGHVEGASCRVDKASKVAVNNLRRASSFVCDVDLFFNVSPQIWRQRSCWRALSCQIVAGWFGGMSLRPMGECCICMYFPSWNPPLMFPNFEDQT